APALLVLMRILQGLFVGGEWSGAMTLVVENAPLHLRARYAAIPQIGSPIGTILSSGGFFVMTLLFSQENFDSFGWRMPFLVRILQGLFVGGEWSGAMTLVVENAPLHLRARYAAIPQIGSPIGTILSSGGFFVMTLLFSQENFDSFGWRIPFLVAIPLLLVAVYIRSRLEESPVFRQLEESGEVSKSPIRTTFTESWKQIIVGMAAALLGVGGFYLVTAFCVWYGVNILGYDDSLLLLGSM